MAGNCCSWFTSTNFFVYISHLLSSWGDRMWSFGVGLFLINISPDSLQLTAIYGLCRGLSVLLLGALIGDIVDRTPRLRAAQTALLLQNFFVVIDAVVIYLFLVYRTDVESHGEWSTHVTYAIIITLAILSRLTSIARSIAVEKDWIVEICGCDSEMLATMTASLRRIDLSTSILAPIATGLVMTLAGVEVGALLIGGWNICSVVVEYYFLWRVYNTVPELMKKKNFVKAKAKKEEKQEEVALDDKLPETVKKEDTEEDTNDKEHLKASYDDADEIGVKIDENAECKGTQETSPTSQASQGSKCPKLFRSLERLYIGWPIYTRYEVLYSGLALACLYLTVLGFDSITIGYAKMQGISESLIGVMMAVGSLFGIFGTFLYPIMRKRLTLPRTGIFGLSIEVICLVSCVVSVWMPGSPFDLSLGFSSGRSYDNELQSNCTTGNTPTTLDYAGTPLVNYSISDAPNSSSSSIPACPTMVKKSDSQISVWMLLAGIVTARMGLWIADLSITQLFLENVKEEERGKVNGVQSSLNQLMDLLKFLLVILLPYEHQFGLMVLISFCFILLGWLSYAHFLRKTRGHFFHTEKCLCGNASNGHVPSSVEA